jgi:hypothetical protein
VIGHISDLTAAQHRELLALLTQEPADLQTDDEVLAELSETLRRQLSLSAATDLAEGFRRRMIRIAEELSEEDHGPGHYDFQSDRRIAKDLLKQVGVKAEALSSDADGDFMADFAKTFRTMSQDRRAAWLRRAALAASAAETDEAAAQLAADAAKQKSTPEDTAERIAKDVARIAPAVAAARAAGVRRATLAVRPPATLAAAASLGLVAGGAIAFAIRQRRSRAAQQKARDADNVQVRRDRQATQAVVTTCAYVLAAVEAAESPPMNA